MFIFECPSCKTKLQAAEEHAGKIIQCPKCRQTATVPKSADAPAEAITTAPPAPAPPPPEQAQAEAARRERDGDPEDRPLGRVVNPTVTAGRGLGAGMTVLIVLGVSACCLLGAGSVVVALLVPAVSRVREAAARTQSTNNLKQIALACHAFHDSHKRLPFNGTVPAVGGDDNTGSWAFQILPYIEQAPMFNAIERRRAVPSYQCPGRSRPPVEIAGAGGGGAWTDYFLNNYLNDAAKAEIPNNPNMNRSMRDITDGTSLTVIVGHGNINVDQYASSTNVTLSTNIFTGGTAGTMRSGNNGAINPAGVTLQRDSATAPGIGSWGGPFSQGGLMAMVDASVRVFPYTTNNFSAFLTPAGGEAVLLPDT